MSDNRDKYLIEAAHVGYIRGHHDTVEGCYAAPDEAARDIVADMHIDLDPAVTEACEPLGRRKELEGYLAMMDDALNGALRLLRDMQPNEHAEFEKMRAEVEPCGHDPDRQVGIGSVIWCLHCGAIRRCEYTGRNAKTEWRLPERGK